MFVGPTEDGIHLILHNAVCRNWEHCGTRVELFGYNCQLFQVATSKHNPFGAGNQERSGDGLQNIRSAYLNLSMLSYTDDLLDEEELKLTNPSPPVAPVTMATFPSAVTAGFWVGSIAGYTSRCIELVSMKGAVSRMNWSDKDSIRLPEIPSPEAPID